VSGRSVRPFLPFRDAYTHLQEIAEIDEEPVKSGKVGLVYGSLDPHIFSTMPSSFH